MKTEEEIKRIKQLIIDNKIEKAQKNWGGADIVIDNKPHKENPNSFYPEPRYVISEYSLEISWIFEQLKHAFYSENLLDSCSKIEFFGRLANSINNSNTDSKQDICMAILNEAEKIHAEIIKGTFKSLVIANGNEILDDYKRGNL